jgi:hypothetical protein
MLNRITAAVGTMVITGMLVLPAWAQSPFSQPPPPGYEQPPPGYEQPPPDYSNSCPNVVSEQEPNDLQTGQDIQDLSVLQSGTCVSVSPASINSSADFDFYLLGLNGVSQLSLQLQIQSVTQQALAPFAYVVLDAYTGGVLAECYDVTCQAYVQTDLVVVGVVANDVFQYGLDITAAGGQQPYARSSVDTLNLAEMHDRVLNRR